MVQYDCVLLRVLLWTVLIWGWGNSNFPPDPEQEEAGIGNGWMVQQLISYREMTDESFTLRKNTVMRLI